MEVPFLSADLQWEEVRLLVGLNEALLVLQLANILDFDCLWAAHAWSHHDLLSVSGQLDLPDAVAHEGVHGPETVEHGAGGTHVEQWA